MFYTRKGDSGTTKVFSSAPGERLSKASSQIEALGSLDELNSFLGLCKVQAGEWKFRVGASGPLLRELIHEVQENLFIVQAELAGAQKSIDESKIRKMEEVIDVIEHELPPLKGFSIAGGSELSALLDVARTLARRAERRVVEALRRGEVKIEDSTVSFLNRLSSLIFALARLANHKFGIKEEPPSYR